MTELHPMFSYGTDAIHLCPKCETAGGYIRRIPRPWWHRWLMIFSRKKHYACQECNHRFYVKSADSYE